MVSRANSAPPTLEDVARLAGVSRATASRVVRREEAVSPRAREAVEGAIGELGYVPNRVARSLATRKADTIAVVVSEPDARVFSDPFFATTIAGVAQTLEPTAKHLALVMGYGGSRTKLGQYLRGGYADGVVVVSQHEDDQIADLLRDLDVPCAFIGRPIGADDTTSALRNRYVDMDNVAGGMIATRRLIDVGCTRIATVTGPSDMAAAVDRLTGCQLALAEEGLELVAAYNGKFTPEGAQVQALRIVDERPDIDAIFVASDMMAAGVMGVLSANGYRIPEDLKVVGFDDSVVALTTTPALTTVTNPGRELAGRATMMVLDQLEGREPTEPVILKPELIVRASA